MSARLPNWLSASSNSGLVSLRGVGDLVCCASRAFAVVSCDAGLLLFSLASAWRLRGASVAPVRGGICFWFFLRRFVRFACVVAGIRVAPSRRNCCPCAGWHVLLVCLATLGLVCLCCRWHPRCAFAAQALPLCGAALTFFAAAKKVSKESGLTPPILDHRLRAPNGSSPSHGNFSVAVRCQRFESAPHPLHSPVAQPGAANGLGRPGGKLCVGRNASHVSALTTPIVLFSPEWCVYAAKAYTQFAAIERG